MVVTSIEALDKIVVCNDLHTSQSIHFLPAEFGLRIMDFS